MKRLVLLLLLLCCPSSAWAGTLTDKVTLKPLASPSCTSGYGCLYVKTADSLMYIVDAAGLELKSNAARSFRTSTSCSGLGSPSVGDVCYDSVLDVFRAFTGSGWFTFVASTAGIVTKAQGGTGQDNTSVTAAKVWASPPTATGAAAYVTLSKQHISGATDPFYSRSCTLTSAAAATPVNCLLDADVPAGQKAYLLGWRAKVNGATAWATTATCVIEDTAAANFVTIAVAALTGNAYVVDTTANVTLASAYSRNLGGTTAKGLQISCNTNGTGSDLVVTVYGVIK